MCPRRKEFVMKKMITTISIVAVCLAANMVVSAEFVTGEMSLSQASETYGGGGGGSCCGATFKPCSGTCSPGYQAYIKSGTATGYSTCVVSGSGACGTCNSPDTAYNANLCGF